MTFDIREYHKEYYQRPEVIERVREYAREYQKQYNHDKRQEFLSIYGKDCCFCKGDVALVDLAIHHINDDGPEERAIRNQYSILKGSIQYPDLTRYATSHRRCHASYHNPKMRTNQDKREYNKEYYQRPEVRERRLEYLERPEVIQRTHEYRRRLEVKERDREYSRRPEVKKRRLEYREQPEVNERMRKYRQNPEAKERQREYDKERYQRRVKAEKGATS